MGVDCLTACVEVLKEAGKPLHYSELTRQILDRGLWTTSGATPDATVNARLAVEIQRRGTDARIVRVEPGVFALRTSISPAKAPQESPPSNNQPAPSNSRADTRERLTMRDIRRLAKDLVLGSPDGIRYGSLISTILDQHPSTSRNTIQGAIWNLDATFPEEISKPSRGLFRPLAAIRRDETETAAQVTEEVTDKVRESDFYDVFADWLKNDLGDATEAAPLGGAALGQKWGTPDVLGTYKPLAGDKLKFPTEIIAAEIKLDPRQPVVAFGQAVAYRIFAAKTYVVMPRSITEDDRDRLEALCMLFGVGLIIYQLDPQQPDFEIRVRAQRHAPDMYYVNKFADALYRHSEGLYNRLF